MKANGREGIAYNVPRRIVDGPQGASRVLIRRAQISLLFFLAAYFLRNGRVADAFDDAADDWDRAGDVFGC